MEYRTDKTSSNWRHILTTPLIDYCATQKFANMFPAYVAMIENTKKNLFPNISLDCPVQPGKYYVNIDEFTGIPKEYKYTEEEVRNYKPTNGFGYDLPGGIYRFIIRASTKTDPNGWFLTWNLQIKGRMHEENF
jgi:hypothetical protein